MLSYIRCRYDVAILRDAEHGITTRLNDELMNTFFASLSRNNVFDSTIAVVSASNALKRSSVDGIDHSLAARVKFDCSTVREDHECSDKLITLNALVLVPIFWDGD